ncbi:MAG: hypothetical protein QOI38_1951 [Sphingomonadales bacterium]|jgi:hypothetical protein|nr:hypothetical protein [Sphingomonadales bacterium]
MIRPSDEIAEDIATHFSEHDQPLMVYRWNDFYEISDAKRLHKSRLDEIAEYAKDDHGLIVGFGNRSIAVCRDKVSKRYRRGGEPIKRS